MSDMPTTKGTIAVAEIVLRDLPPLVEASKRDDIREHLLTFHVGYGGLSHYLSWQARRSPAKVDLLALHDRIHAGEYGKLEYRLAYDDAGYRLSNYAETYDGEVVGLKPFLRPHTHFTVAPIIERGTAMTAKASKTTAASKTVATREAGSNGTVATAEGGAILKSSEKQSLIRLLKGDFAALKIDVQNYAQTAQKAAVEEVEAEYKAKDKDAAKVADDLVRFRRKVEDDFAALAAKARERGIDIPGARESFTRYFPSTVSVIGKDAALSKARNEVAQATTRALNLLERQSIAAERNVLLASLTTEARAMLDALPTAESLFREAMEADKNGATR